MSCPRLDSEPDDRRTAQASGPSGHGAAAPAAPGQTQELSFLSLKPSPGYF